MIDGSKNTKNVQQVSNLFQYVLSGTPVPLQRPRHGIKKVYDPQKQIKYAAGLQLKMQHQHLIFEGVLRLDIIFFMPIPSRLSRKQKETIKPYGHHTKKPDIDNLLKFVLDVGNGILYHDDAIFSEIHAKKMYSLCPRTEFTITRLGEHYEEVQPKT